MRQSCRTRRLRSVRHFASGCGMSNPLALTVPAWIRNAPLGAFSAEAAAVVESDAVIRTYAAVEWDCLGDDGKDWLAAIIRETLARAAERQAAGAL